MQRDDPMDRDTARGVRPTVCALVLAGGQGLRAGAAVPKQFVAVGGRPVRAHTMGVFQASARVSHVHVVCAPQWADFVRRAAGEAGIGKLRLLPEAGATGIDSLMNGLQRLSQFYCGEDMENVWVMVHDSVRPLVTTGLIDANLDVALQRGNAITAVQSPEAYMVSDDGIQSLGLVPREALWRAQTPMTFTLGFLSRTLLEPWHEGRLPSSQSLYTLVRQLCPAMPLFIAPGSPLNFKLTTPEDLRMLERLL